MKLATVTSDLSHVYRDGASAPLAQNNTADQGGTVASFTRDNTIVITETVYHPVFVPEVTLHPIDQADEAIVDLVQP